MGLHASNILSLVYGSPVPSMIPYLQLHHAQAPIYMHLYPSRYLRPAKKALEFPSQGKVGVVVLGESFQVACRLQLVFCTTCFLLSCSQLLV